MPLLSYSALVDPFLQDVRIYVAGHLDIEKGDRILDVCCGTGDQAFHYSQKGAVVTGIDLNYGMIQTAEEHRRQRGMNNITFHQGNAAELPFPDGYFDHASISLALHEMQRETRNRVISEMKRVVKKSGTIMFTDFKVPMPSNPVGFFLKTVELIAGRENNRCFRDYLAQGGLPGILKQNRLDLCDEMLFKTGNIQVIKSCNV